jgi:transposase-like protein
MSRSLTCRRHWSCRMTQAEEGGRGQFPSEQAALKVLYLAVGNLEEFRGPDTGIRSSGWKQALQAFTIYFDGRIPTP